jgi:hypothetical protein
MSKVSASDMKKPHHAFAKEGRKRVEDAAKSATCWSPSNRTKILA